MICPERIRPTYEWHTTVATVDVGPDRLLTPTAQLRMQQEVGELHFGEGGLGFANIATLGMAFLLCQNNAVIYRRPAACEAVTVKTWSHSVKGIRFFRCYRFEDADGNTLIDSTASFVLVDVYTHSLIRPKNFPYAITHCPDIPHTCPMPPTLKMAEEMTFVGKHVVKYSQLDFNGHLNNTRYADIVFDHLPPAAMETLCGFSVTFAHEAKLNDKLSLSMSQQGGDYLLHAQNGDTTCFTAQVRTTE